MNIFTDSHKYIQEKQRNKSTPTLFFSGSYSYRKTLFYIIRTLKHINKFI